jgi:hypothetical protein
MLSVSDFVRRLRMVQSHLNQPKKLSTLSMRLFIKSLSRRAMAQGETAMRTLILVVLFIMVSGLVHAGDAEQFCEDSKAWDHFNALVEANPNDTSPNPSCLENGPLCMCNPPVMLRTI